MLDKLIQREDLYGLLFVELTEAELCMLYSVLHPRKWVDSDAVHAVLLAQEELLKQRNEFGWVEVLHQSELRKCTKHMGGGGALFC